MHAASYECNSHVTEKKKRIHTSQYLHKCIKRELENASHADRDRPTSQSVSCSRRVKIASQPCVAFVRPHRRLRRRKLRTIDPPSPRDDDRHLAAAAEAAAPASAQCNFRITGERTRTSGGSRATTDNSRNATRVLFVWVKLFANVQRERRCACASKVHCHKVQIAVIVVVGTGRSCATIAHLHVPIIVFIV